MFNYKYVLTTARSISNLKEYEEDVLKAIVEFNKKSEVSKKFKRIKTDSIRIKDNSFEFEISTDLDYGDTPSLKPLRLLSNEILKSENLSSYTVDKGILRIVSVHRVIDASYPNLQSNYTVQEKNNSVKGILEDVYILKNNLINFENKYSNNNIFTTSSTSTNYNIVIQNMNNLEDGELGHKQHIVEKNESIISYIIERYKPDIFVMSEINYYQYPTTLELNDYIIKWSSNIKANACTAILIKKELYDENLQKDLFKLEFDNNDYENRYLSVKTKYFELIACWLIQSKSTSDSYPARLIMNEKILSLLDGNNSIIVCGDMNADGNIDTRIKTKSNLKSLFDIVCKHDEQDVYNINSTIKGPNIRENNNTFKNSTRIDKFYLSNSLLAVSNCFIENDSYLLNKELTDHKSVILNILITM